MNLNSLVKDFFEENEFDRLANKVSVVRSDGTVLYCNSKDSFEASNIGALASGIWQAASSLSQMINKGENSSAFRLAFDTTSEGIYILPIDIASRDCYLCCLFKDQLNPGKLKQSMRNIGFLLEAYMREEALRFEAQELPRELRSGYLFKDITDEEMDRLFGVAGV